VNDALRSSRCCFTGHRPQSLRRSEDDIRVDLENSILAAVREGCRTFISGMACGVDIWAAEIVVRMKDQFPDLNLHLIAAIPYAGFDERWPEDWRERYRALLKNVEMKQVFEKSEVKVWECRNCGHIVVGTKAPDVCPVCAHPQSYFEVNAENY
jgi:hypothetical protein